MSCKFLGLFFSAFDVTISEQYSSNAYDGSGLEWSAHTRRRQGRITGQGKR